MAKGKYDVDMWFGDSLLEADKVNYYWSNLTLRYQGNIWKGGRMVGDFWATEFEGMKMLFPQLDFERIYQ